MFSLIQKQQEALDNDATAATEAACSGPDCGCILGAACANLRAASVLSEAANDGNGNSNDIAVVRR